MAFPVPLLFTVLSLSSCRITVTLSLSRISNKAPPISLISIFSPTIRFLYPSSPIRFPPIYQSQFRFCAHPKCSVCDSTNRGFYSNLDSGELGFFSEAMKIEDLDDLGSDCDEIVYRKQIVRVDTKRVLVGAGARILFYPTLLYNVFRNKIQSEFRWWDEVDQFLLLGAVPFPGDVPRLKNLGVGGVITLNEPYETLVPSSLYHAHGIDHLVIPTRDYLFAPSFVDISKAVNFIHENATCGRTTYVHCKAGRGRSTTIVLCYLVKHKHMTPASALEYVRSIRPRVLLAPSQWKAVEKYSTSLLAAPTNSPSADVVLITKADLEGYRGACDNAAAVDELAVVSRMVRACRLSCLFASLRVSGSYYGSIPGRVPEARAC